MQTSSGPVPSPRRRQVHHPRWQVLRGLGAAVGALALVGGVVAAPAAAHMGPSDPGSPAGGAWGWPGHGVVVRDLGSLGVGSESRPAAVNDRGEVAATTQDETGATRVVLWTPGRGLRDLGPGTAVDLNDRGQVLGTDFLWDPVRGRTGLGTLGGAPFATRARDLDDRGRVVGQAVSAAGEPRAFVWTRPTGMRALPGLGGDGAGAVLINDRGTIAGTAVDRAGLEQVVVWQGPHWRARVVGADVLDPASRPPDVVDLTEGGRLVGGSAPGVFVWDARHGLDLLGCWDGLSCDATDMNERGTVVGRWQDPVLDVDAAFVWTPRGGLQVLTTSPDTFAYTAQAVAVDDAGRVVGNAQSQDPAVDGAFWWTARAGLQHLPDLGAGQAEVVALGGRGHAVGVAPGPDGTQHLVMWVLGPRCR